MKKDTNEQERPPGEGNREHRVRRQLVEENPVARVREKDDRHE